MKVRVDYGDPDELLADWEQQLSKGGFLARIPPPEGLALFSEAEVTLAFLGAEDTLAGQVLQVFPGVGVAVSVAPGPGLETLLEAARARTGGGGAPATHALDETPDAQASGGAPAPGRPATEAHLRVQEAGKAEKIKMARYGSKSERMLIMRGNDPSVHRFVLNNPGLGLDEVRTIAAMTTMPVETLKIIAEKSEWAHRPEIALALVRNPKTPLPLAQKLVAHLGMGDLRQLAKSSKLRMPLLHAVRKRVIGP